MMEARYLFVQNIKLTQASSNKESIVFMVAVLSLFQPHALDSSSFSSSLETFRKFKAYCCCRLKKMVREVLTIVKCFFVFWCVLMDENEINKAKPNKHKQKKRTLFFLLECRSMWYSIREFSLGTVLC